MFFLHSCKALPVVVWYAWNLLCRLGNSVSLSFFTIVFGILVFLFSVLWHQPASATLQLHLRFTLCLGWLMVHAHHRDAQSNHLRSMALLSRRQVGIRWDRVAKQSAQNISSMLHELQATSYYLPFGPWRLGTVEKIMENIENLIPCRRPRTS